MESIETDFVPVAIHNNRPGPEAEFLKRYDEPAWNFPVMRFIDADGKDLLPRRDRIWTTNEVAQRLVEALRAAGRDVPAYLDLAATETETTPRALKATFAMHCFWEGEGRLGAIEGVIGTRAGWLQGRGKGLADLVVDDTLLASARRMQCADKVFAHEFDQLTAARAAGDDVKLIKEPARSARPDDQKYWLKQSELRFLPLTPMQATKVNADLRNRTDPRRSLSPRQLKLRAAVKAALQNAPDVLNDLQWPGTLDALPAYHDAVLARIRSTRPTREATP